MIVKLYNNFVNESRGLVDSTLEYSKYLIKYLDINFNNFFKSNKDVFEKKDTVIGMPIQEDFSISEFVLDSKFERIDNESFFDKYKSIAERNKWFTTTGLCYNIGEEDGSEILEDGTIKLRISFGAIINKEKFTSKDIDDLQVEIKSSILHELNHAYEGYKRHIGEKPEIPTTLTYALDFNVADVHKNVWKLWWKKIGYYIYWTEKHEINAMIQDAFPYVDKYDLEKMKDKAPSWDFYQRMTKFNAVNFKNEMVQEIRKSMPDSDPEEVLTNMKNGLADKLEEMMSEYETTDVSINPKLIKKLSVDEFFKYCEKRILNGAEKLRRGIIKHYSRK